MISKRERERNGKDIDIDNGNDDEERYYDSIRNSILLWRWDFINFHDFVYNNINNINNKNIIIDRKIMVFIENDYWVRELLTYIGCVDINCRVHK